MGVTTNLSGTSAGSSKGSRRTTERREKYREPPRQTLQKLAHHSQSNASHKTDSNDGSERGRKKKKSAMVRAFRSMSPFRRGSKKSLDGSARSKKRRERMPRNFEESRRSITNINIDGGAYKEKDAIPLVAVNLSDDSSPDRRSKKGFSFRSLSPFRRRGSLSSKRRNSRTSTSSDPFDEDEGVSI